MTSYNDGHSHGVEGGVTSGKHNPGGFCKKKFS